MDGLLEVMLIIHAPNGCTRLGHLNRCRADRWQIFPNTCRKNRLEDLSIALLLRRAFNKGGAGSTARLAIQYLDDQTTSNVIMQRRPFVYPPSLCLFSTFVGFDWALFLLGFLEDELGNSSLLPLGVASM